MRSRPGTIRSPPAHTERAGVACRLYSAWALWYLGFPDGALQKVESAACPRPRLAHASGLAFALIWAAALHIRRREFDPACTRAEAAVEIARKHRMSAWFGHATVCRGFALVGLESPGRRDRANSDRLGRLACDRSSLARYPVARLHCGSPLRAGQLDDALDALDRAAETAAATGECHYQAELYRLRGGSCRKPATLPKRHHGCTRDREARSQQAKSLELRAATSLARLWARPGRASRPTICWPDLRLVHRRLRHAGPKDAKALLDELG